MLLELEQQHRKKMVIPNEKLPPGPIKERYWLYNKQMGPRVIQA